MSKCLAAILVLMLAACASVEQHQQLDQTTGAELSTYTGGTIVSISKSEDLPNAFGGKDIWGGKRDKGSIELKYLGLAVNGNIKLRVLSTDIETNENWRRRFRREGYAVSDSDAVDFEHNPAESFIIEGYQVDFSGASTSGIRYRISKAAGGH